MKRRRYFSRRSVKCSLLIVASVFALAASEVAARIYVWKTGIPRRVLLMQKAGLFKSHPDLMYTFRPGARCEPYQGGVLHVNSLGFRGPEIEKQKRHGCLRIVCVGGSTTASSQVPDAATYPKRLGELLQARMPGVDIEVINAGVPGYNSQQTLTNLKLRVLDLEPDLLVVYHAVNDVHPRLVPGFQSDYSHHQRPLQLETIPAMSRFSHYSSLWALLRLRWYRQHVGLTKLVHKVPISTIPVSQQYKNFKQTTADTFRQNIESVVDMATSCGVDLVLSTFAYNDIALRKKQGSSYVAYRSGICQHNDEMRSVAERHGLLLVDVAEQFPDDARLFNDPVHLNSHGTAAKAQLFADAILKSGLLTARLNYSDVKTRSKVTQHP